MLFRASLAGNKFDLGAKATTDEHAAGGIDFFKTFNQLPLRPWFVDHLDAIASRLTPKRCPYKKAMFFVDNAGADVVLGAMPIARYLADCGCAVVLAANDEPSLNDVILTELNEVLAAAARIDDRIAAHRRAGRITTVGTGCDCPLIDLSDVSQACNAAAADCDLVILEGMGRAIETNYRDPFTCDVIHLAMIKNPHVAAYIGCQMFGLVVKFTPAAR
jgi:type II pantothenate kinase